MRYFDRIEVGGQVYTSDGDSTDVLGCWFYAKYGFSIVVGQCVARVKGGYLLRFRWGDPYRTTQFVYDEEILAKAEDPRWLSRLAKLFKSAKYSGKGGKNE